MSLCDDCIHWWDCDEAGMGFCDYDDDPDELYWEYVMGDGLDKER